MKKLSKTSVLILLSVFLINTSCNKEGKGGNSTISGKLVGADHDDAKPEVTEITFTNGNTVEHGDYFLLNSPSLAAYFYVWYDNPTWISNGDPNLVGRVGIPVTFNYSDSNTDLANNTASAILGTTSAYTIETLNDILILSCTIQGASPDADNATSPFNMDILTQGKDASLKPETELIDEKVYITYGANTISDDLVRTVVDGSFQFTGLTKGDYIIHVPSKDTLTGLETSIEVTAEVVSNKSIVDVGTINIYF